MSWSFLGKSGLPQNPIFFFDVQKEIQKKILLVKPKVRKQSFERGEVAVNLDGKHIPFFFQKKYFVTAREIQISLRCSAGWWAYRCHDFDTDVSLDLIVFLEKIDSEYRILYVTGPKTSNLGSDGNLIGSSLKFKVSNRKNGLEIVARGRVYSVSSPLFGTKANQIDISVGFPGFIWGISK